MAEIITSTAPSRIDTLRDGLKAICELCNTIHNALYTSASTVACQENSTSALATRGLRKGYYKACARKKIIPKD